MYWVLLNFSTFLLSFGGFRGFYWVLLDFSTFYLVLRGFRGFC